MEEIIYEMKEISDVPRVAKEFVDNISEAKVFAFKGDMGAGKTTFIVQVLKAMGVEEPDGSPTYSLVNSYESPMFGEILHFDLYRLMDEEEAMEAGIEELFYSNAFCFVEWPEQAAGILPSDTIWVEVKHRNDNVREIHVKS